MALNNDERRQEIRDEIKASSKQEFILKEMKRLGFWPDDAQKPHLAETHIKRQSQLNTEIRELSKKNKAFENKEAVLLKLKKERMKRSRQQQKENKKRREEDRLAKKAEWKEKQAKDILYLGKPFTAALKNKTNDQEKLRKNKLPALQDVLELAEKLETTVSELRYLSFYRPLTKVSHYIRYAIPKKTGGLRHISAPMPRLKKVQRSILNNLLSNIPISDYAHGFVSDRSIVSNARPHIKADLVVNMDLKDFFPSLDFKRVCGLYRKLGFSDQIATVLALICTEPVEEKIKVDGEIFYLSEGERVLPQGSPCSPAITNIICRRLDQRMAGIGRKLGFTYTRYADDMTFSGSESNRNNIKKLMWQTQAVIKDEDFTLHPDKTRIMSNGARKEVTGIVVNEKANISRKKLKQFRALLFQIEKDGLKGKTWGNSDDLLASIQGFARYVYMVDSVKGKKYLDQVQGIKNKFAPKPKVDKKPWWKFWG